VRVSLTSLRGGPAVGRGPRDRGFTLIELLVVAAILGLAAAIAAPRIGALGPRVDLGTSARQVIDVVRLLSPVKARQPSTCPRGFPSMPFVRRAARK